MVKQTGVLGRHVGPLNTAGSLLKGKSSGLRICPLYPDSNSMRSNCCSSDMLVSDNEWCPASRPLHNSTEIREIAITLAFPIQLSQNDSLLLVNQLRPTAHQPTCASTGYCVTSLHPLLRAPSYSDCTCTMKCTSLLLPPASFIPHCRATEVSAPWNEPQHAENVVQFLERMKLQPSRSCGFFIVVVLVDAWVDKTFLQAIRNWQILWLPYLSCSVQNCLCISLVSEYTERADLSLT